MHPHHHPPSEKLTSAHEHCPSTIKRLTHDISIKTQLFTSQLGQMKQEVSVEKSRTVAVNRQLKVG